MTNCYTTDDGRDVKVLGGRWTILSADRMRATEVYLRPDGITLATQWGEHALTLPEGVAADLMAAEAEAKQRRLAAQSAPQPSRRVPAGSSVSQAEYNNLRDSIGSKYAAHMARQMQG